MAKGCMVFIVPPPPGGWQNYKLLVGHGKKYDNLLRKNMNVRGKRWKKGVKSEFFNVLGRKNIILEKGGGGKISINWTIYTPGMTPEEWIKIVNMH